MEQWRYMEELENIARNEPVFPGDIINKGALKVLEKACLVGRNDDGNVILIQHGQELWKLWIPVYQERLQ